MDMSMLASRHRVRGDRRVRGLAAVLLAAAAGCGVVDHSRPAAPATEPVSEESPDDAAFLVELEKRSLRFFVECADPLTGLVSDSAKRDGSESQEVASSAAMGFGLTALCIGAEYGWLDREEAERRVLKTLRFLLESVEHERGFVYHFLDKKTGKRVWNSEASSIDTALLLGGALTAKQFFDNPEIAVLADAMYARVDWPWMLNGGRTLSMGWAPESGFIEARWDHFSEHTLMDLLAIGSPTHPVDADLWHAWRREPVVTYDGRTFLQHPPLFVHQFSHAWIDYRNKRDAWANYWNNSVQATLAHRQFIIDQRDRFPHYGPELWGVTSSDSASGYASWGGPPQDTGFPIDGTVVPCAAAGSLPFTPEVCLKTLTHMKERYGDRIWGPYGFADAFNPATGWVSDIVIGIDVGITLLMAENYRSGFVWEYFMRNSEIQDAMWRAGFVGTGSTIDKENERYLRTLARQTWNSIADLAHPETGLPYDSTGRHKHTSVSNIGIYLSCIVAARDMGLISPEEALHRARQSLGSIEKLKTWMGFQQSWNNVESLQPSGDDTWISILDSGNMAGGLIAAAEAFPEEKERFMAVFNAMDWAAFYDAEREVLLGGYNTADQKFNPDWTLPLLGADSHLAVFCGVASGKVPAACWNNQDRGWEERYHVRYLKPGWQGGGLFMQFINGLWLDERESLLGQSAANFALAQILHARNQSLPVWGWSACEAPDGTYLGWGKLVDEVVTPHASVLALEYFPDEVLANLRRLDAMGLRHPDFGFSDSVDVKSGKTSSTFLVLDQGMILLSLANFLENQTIRRYFQQSELVRLGRARLPDFLKPQHGGKNAILNLGVHSRNLQEHRVPRVIARRNGEPMQQDWNEVMHPSGEAFRFACSWSEEALLVKVAIPDTTSFLPASPAEMYRDDSVEVFIDPDGDGLVWGKSRDVQIGYGRDGSAWEWFSKRYIPPPTIVETETGYAIHASIPWSAVSVEPVPGKRIGFSVAVNDRISPEEKVKAEWHWNPGTDKIQLGELVLAADDAR